MKFKLNNIIGILYIHIILIILTFVYCDLPIHCVKSQIQGKWIFYAEKPKKMESMNDKYNLLCLHNLPSHEDSSYKTYDHINELKLEKEEIIINLYSNNTCNIIDGDSNVIGKWTMVYNEGIEINFIKENGNYISIFTFFRYSIEDTSQYGLRKLSHCYQTLPGWYRIVTDNGEDYRGCIIGHKDVNNYEEITNGLPSKEMYYVQGGDNINLKGSKLSKIRFTQLSIQSSNTNNLRNQNQDQSKLVNYINENNLIWSAKNYNILKDKTIGDLSNMIKTKKLYLGNYNKHIDKQDIIKLLNIAEPSDGSHLKYINENNIKSINLPKHFNWLNHISEPKEQGNCGSCYAFGFTSSIESRIRIKYKDILYKYKDIFGEDLMQFKISTDHILQCSVYNQGCDGGYGLLVGRFFKEFEMFLEHLYNSNNKCENQNREINPNDKTTKLKLSIKDYYYIGGAYNNSTEDDIMRDLYLNGPLTISFEPESDFATYSNGIYSGLKLDVNNINEINRRNYEWERVDHSVLLIGWGEEVINNNVIKYWIIQNSWGNTWGVHGYGKFIRGVDLDGIESNVEAGIPILEELQ